MKENVLIEKPEEQVHEQKPQQNERPATGIRWLQNLLGGAYLESEKSLRNIPFLFFLALLAILYISGNYMIEENTRKINKLQKTVNEARFEYITQKANLLTMSRLSKISKKLEAMGIKENMEPVKTITINEKEEDN